MKTMTWINASAVVAVAALVLGLAGWGSTGSAGVIHTEASPETRSVLVAQIDTDWLPASSARREIEQRSALIERFAEENGIVLRVTGTGARMRTRAADGSRLDEPQAHFARSFEFHVSRPQDVDLLRRTLATWAVRFEEE